MDYHISWPLNLNFNHCQLGQLSSPDRLSHHLSRRSSYFGVKAIQPDLPDSSTSNPFLSHHETVIPSSLLSAQSDHPHLSFPSDSLPFILPQNLWDSKNYVHHSYGGFGGKLVIVKQTSQSLILPIHRSWSTTCYPKELIKVSQV